MDSTSSRSVTADSPKIGADISAFKSSAARDTFCSRTISRTGPKSSDLDLTNVSQISTISSAFGPQFRIHQVISNEVQHVLIVRAGRLEHANEFEYAFRSCRRERGAIRTANPPYFGE